MKRNEIKSVFKKEKKEKWNEMKKKEIKLRKVKMIFRSFEAFDTHIHKELARNSLEKSAKPADRGPLP